MSKPRKTLKAPRFAFDPKSLTPTPAAKSSRRGDFGGGPDLQNLYYTGPSKPDMKHTSDVSQWVTYSHVQEFPTNSIAALMGYNLNRIGARVKQTLVDASPGHIKDGWHFETKRNGKLVWAMLWNDTIEFQYALTGTALKRKVMIPNARKMSYPIIPLHGAWAGANTPEERRAKIAAYRHDVQAESYTDTLGSGRSFTVTGKSGLTLEEFREKWGFYLKLSGDWIRNEEDPEGPSIMVPSSSYQSFDRIGGSMARKGMGKSTAILKNSGETFVNFIEDFPGRSQDAQLAEAYFKVSPDIYKTALQKMASNMAREVAAAMMGGKGPELLSKTERPTIKMPNRTAFVNVVNITKDSQPIKMFTSLKWKTL